MSKWRVISSLCAVALLLVAQTTGGEKPRLNWFAFNDGMVEAKKSGKTVMIDVYTHWCGWCKKMDKDTYADPGVIDYLSKKYIAIKLNAESSDKLQYREKAYTEREFAAAFGVNGYPSIIFLGNDGEPITIYPGYADATRFKVVLSYIAEDHYKTMKFEDYAASKQ